MPDSRPFCKSMTCINIYCPGKDNFAADREMAERAQASWPTIRTSARENRAFLGRAVRYLAGQVGIRQFLDIGAGLPSAANVHEVAQSTAPSCRVGVLHLIPDEHKPGDIMTTLLDALPRAAISPRPTARRNTRRRRQAARCALSGRRGSHFSRVIPVSSPGWHSPAWNWCRPAGKRHGRRDTSRDTVRAGALRVVPGSVRGHEKVPMCGQV